MALSKLTNTTPLGITGFGLRPSAIQSCIINYLFFIHFQEAENQSDISIGAFFSNGTLIFLPPETSCYHTGGHVTSLLESCPAWMADFSKGASNFSQVWGEVCSPSFLSPYSHVWKQKESASTAESDNPHKRFYLFFQGQNLRVKKN